MFRKDINFVWHDSHDSDNKLRENAASMIDYSRGLGATGLALSVPVYTHSLTASEVFAGPHTPPPHRLGLVTRASVEAGFRVTVRPLLNEKAFGNSGWRGTIRPNNRSHWYDSYAKMLDPFLRICRDTNVAQIDVGTELNSMAQDPNWEGIIQQARELYPGAIGWCNNWDVFGEGLLGPKWVDVQGLDFYPPLSCSDNASIDQLTAAMVAWLRAVPDRINLADIVMSEVGIAAQSGAYARPNHTGDPKEPILPHIQINWLSAACRAVQVTGMTGFCPWMMDLNHPRVDKSPYSKLPMLIYDGRGEKAVKVCFADGSSPSLSQLFPTLRASPCCARQRTFEVGPAELALSDDSTSKPGCGRHVRNADHSSTRIRAPGSMSELLNTPKVMALRLRRPTG